MVVAFRRRHALRRGANLPTDFRLRTLFAGIRRFVLLSVLLATPAAAQSSVDLTARVTFYGDNTEFSNPFREGETLLGTFASVFVDARISERLCYAAARSATSASALTTASMRPDPSSR
jgi:hypothetical protein